THGESAFRVSAGSLNNLRLAVLKRVGHSADIGKLWNLIGSLLCMVGPIREYMEGTVMWLKPTWRGRVLDVGCGNGELLTRLKNFGWEVAGMEPDPTAASLARMHFGIDVRGRMEDFEDASFDVITLSHVIEHLPSPLATLARCLRLLRQ